jgi:nucleoside-diphosphate-sugar epimerase
MKALLLGGNGYLGSLISEINDRKVIFDELVSVDKDGTGSAVGEDIAKLSDDQISKLVLDVDEIFVLASPVGKEVAHDESLMFDLNFRAVASIIRHARESTVVNFFSSGAVFEGYEKVDAETDTWPIPKTSYAKYKWFGENFIYRYAKRFRIIRLASCYGWSPKFKAHTLLNSILNTYCTKETVRIRANRETGVSVVDAMYAMEALLDLAERREGIGETVHLCQQFLPICELVEAINSELPVRVEYLDEAKKVYGYNILGENSSSQEMKDGLVRSAAFFKGKVDDTRSAMATLTK